jgi:hypothetical protein
LIWLSLGQPSEQSKGKAPGQVLTANASLIGGR